MLSIVALKVQPLYEAMTEVEYRVVHDFRNLLLQISIDNGEQ